jgi:tRNA-dihydrouridine synthase
MYDGKANPQLFSEAISAVKHPLVFNGDIFSETNLQELLTILPDQSSFMIGRGLLIDPSLPSRLKGKTLNANELKKKKKEFHDLLLEAYSKRLDGSGHLLIKMNQFWTYFSESFENPHKVMKLVKKSGNLLKYNAAVVEIFRNY